MPLYTIGQTGTPGEIAFAAIHCTVGDTMIGGFSIVAALLLVAPTGWPGSGRGRVLATALVFGVGYTIFSEWLNVEARESWEYSELMPVLPPFGTGLSPILQWLVIPPVVYAMAFRLGGFRSAPKH